MMSRDLLVGDHPGEAVGAEQQDVAVPQLLPQRGPPRPPCFIPSARTITFLCGNASISAGVSARCLM